MMSVINAIYFSDRQQNDLSPENDEVGEVCIANISPLERRKRLVFGIKQFLFTLVVLAVMIVLHLNPFWRLSLLFLFWASAVGYFQALDKT